MAFDWTKVEGYREDMTAEERVALLENYKEPDDKSWKAQFDKASHEVSTLKKQLKEKLTDEEKNAAERAENEQKLLDELAELRRERTIAQYRQSFMEQKYDAATADAMAKAIADGDIAGMFTALKKGNDALEQAIKTELLRTTPSPATGKEPAKQDAPGVTLAKEIGRQKAEANKAASDILARYR